MVAVTVPQGVLPGQMLQVVAPDGSGRMVKAAVPHSIGPGSTFMVQFPPALPRPPPADYSMAPETTGPFPLPSVAPSPIPVAFPVAPEGGKASPLPVGVEGGYDGIAVLPPPSSSLSLAPHSTDSGAHTQQQLGPGQKLIKVQVPPGTMPGTPLNVQVPGEPGRTVLAKIPPGVKEFDVPYTPSSRNSGTAPAAPQQPVAMPPPSQQQLQVQATPGQKLILVRVPPGTAPGSTLHVQIPGENRILAATVPPGNVPEFHLAYTP